MKTITRIILSLCVIFMASGMMAQSNLLNVIEKYSELEKADYVKVNAEDIEIDADANDKIAYMINSLETIRVLEIEKDKKSSAAMYQKAYDILKKDPYTEIISVKSEDEMVSIYVNKEGNDRILESALLVKEGKSATIIYMKGDFSLKKIGGITQMLSEEMMKNITVHGKHVFDKHCEKGHK